MPKLMERVVERRIIGKKHRPNDHRNNGKKNGNLDKSI
jgi:hypothetical protein